MTEYKNSISMDEAFNQIFDNEEDLKEYLSYAFEQYIEDGNFNVFYRALELAIKAKDSMQGFAQKVDLSRMELYNIVQGKKEPKITTLAKILKELGLTLKVA